MLDLMNGFIYLNSLNKFLFKLTITLLPITSKSSKNDRTF